MAVAILCCGKLSITTRAVETRGAVVPLEMLLDILQPLEDVFGAFSVLPGVLLVKRAPEKLCLRVAVVFGFSPCDFNVTVLQVGYSAGWI